MAEAADLVAIGKIIKPFGVRGEVRVLSLSDVPGRFDHLQEVTVVARSGRSVITRVTQVRPHSGAYVVAMDAFSTPEEAAVFRGGLIKIPITDVPALPDGHFYEFELIGLTVKDETGRVLGTLEEVFKTESNPIFVVRADGRECLIPGTRDMVARVDRHERTMIVRWVETVWEERHAV